VYEPISGKRLRGSMRQSPTSTPSKAVGGARPPVLICMITSGSRSFTNLHVSLNLSTRIVGFNNSFLECICKIDTPSLMHSCIWSAISFGEHGRSLLFSRVLMLPVVASVIINLP